MNNNVFKYALNSGVLSCEGKTCGVMCANVYGPGVCDGHGRCADPLENPCSKHGCDGLNCGDKCLMGDIMGQCDVRLNCVLGMDNLGCGRILQ